MVRMEGEEEEERDEECREWSEPKSESELEAPS
jgi:hypothetical protein